MNNNVSWLTESDETMQSTSSTSMDTDSAAVPAVPALMLEDTASVAGSTGAATSMASWTHIGTPRSSSSARRPSPSHVRSGGVIAANTKSSRKPSPASSKEYYKEKAKKAAAFAAEKEAEVEKLTRLKAQDKKRRQIEFFELITSG